MINKLKLTNVGPAPKMEMDFANRLNIITGDNGLSKSFLLDIIWWVLTRTWPTEVNPNLTLGLKAFSDSPDDAEILAHFKGWQNNDIRVDRYKYHRQNQQWIPAAVSSTNETWQTNLHETQRLVLYAG